MYLTKETLTLNHFNTIKCLVNNNNSDVGINMVYGNVCQCNHNNYYQ